MFAVPAAFFLYFNQVDLFILFLVFQAIGDRLDGFLARRWHAVSVSGKWLDTIADITFFLGIFAVMLASDTYRNYVLFFVPGVALGVLALAIRMVRRGRLFTFPNRPIDHVSLVLYVAIAVALYAQRGGLILFFAIAGAIAILISSTILLYRAVLIE